MIEVSSRLSISGQSLENVSNLYDPGFPYKKVQDAQHKRYRIKFL